MSWSSFEAALFLNGIMVATASGSIGLNYRKNGFFNAGLAGIAYLGAVTTDVLGRMIGVNPYWSIPLALVLGAALNLGLNMLYLDMMQRIGDRKTVQATSIASSLVLYLVGRQVFSFFSGRYSIDMLDTLETLDFELFRTPGVVIVGSILFLFSLLYQFALSPVVEDREENPFDRWEVVVYSLAGASAFFAGSLYRFWFPSGGMLFVLLFAGALFGGVDKKLNPFIGGLLVSILTFILTSTGFDLGGYSIGVPFSLGVISVLFYPMGVIGRIRSVIEFSY